MTNQSDNSNHHRKMEALWDLFSLTFHQSQNCTALPQITGCKLL